MRQQGKRLPCMLPSGDQYLQNRIQFVHVDDVARLVKFILEKNEPEGRRLTILNVAGRGGPLTYEQCVRLANAKLVRVPSEKLFALVLRILWNIKLSTIPPDVAPYMTSDTVMDTSRLQAFLGSECGTILRFSIADAFAECFAKPEVRVQAMPAAKS
jgi:nucleoside-diphosphate-sugar epimerase